MILHRYGNLCTTLGAKALTCGGKLLTEWPVDQLCVLNSVSVQYKNPLALPIEQAYLPMTAPLAYSASKTEQVRSWFDLTVMYMGLAIGEHIYQSVPHTAYDFFYSKIL